MPWRCVLALQHALCTARFSKAAALHNAASARGNQVSGSTLKSVLAALETRVSMTPTNLRLMRQYRHRHAACTAGPQLAAGTAQRVHVRLTHTPAAQNCKTATASLFRTRSQALVKQDAVHKQILLLRSTASCRQCSVLPQLRAFCAPGLQLAQCPAVPRPVGVSRWLAQQHSVSHSHMLVVGSALQRRSKLSGAQRKKRQKQAQAMRTSGPAPASKATGPVPSKHAARGTPRVSAPVPGKSAARVGKSATRQSAASNAHRTTRSGSQRTMSSQLRSAMEGGTQGQPASHAEQAMPATAAATKVCSVAIAARSNPRTMSVLNLECDAWKSCLHRDRATLHQIRFDAAHFLEGKCALHQRMPNIDRVLQALLSKLLQPALRAWHTCFDAATHATWPDAAYTERNLPKPESCPALWIKLVGGIRMREHTTIEGSDTHKACSIIGSRLKDRETLARHESCFEGALQVWSVTNRRSSSSST